MEAWQFRALAETFQPDPTKNIEDSAWENLMVRSTNNNDIEHSVQPVYGIDAEETLFDNDEPWNMSRFTTAHSIINDFSTEIQRMPGIQSSFVNIGMLYTWFCIHHEDSDLASVNFLHSGEPKHWYCVPARERVKLEQLLMKLLNPIYICETVYLHKCFLIPPEMLVKEGIEFTKVVQYPGEIIFTHYGAYHWGFNAGFNVCESTNLASPMYKEIHSKAITCPQTCSFGKGTTFTHSCIGKLLQRWEKLYKNNETVSNSEIVELNIEILDEASMEMLLNMESNETLNLWADEVSFILQTHRDISVHYLITYFQGFENSCSNLSDVIELNENYYVMNCDNEITSDQNMFIPQLESEVEIETVGTNHTSIQEEDEGVELKGEEVFKLEEKEAVEPEEEEAVESEQEGNTKKKRKVAAICEKCNKTFSRASTKKVHDNTFHGEYLTVYSCQFCDHESLFSKVISSHHASTHEDIPMPTEIISKLVKNTEERKILYL